MSSVCDGSCQFADPGLAHAAAEAAYSPVKPLDNTDFVMYWRRHMARIYVAGTLRELGGLPQGLPHPETEDSVPAFRIFSSSSEGMDAPD